MADLEECINRLETLAMIGDVGGLLRKIQEIVPSYGPSHKEPPFTVSEAGEKYRVLVVDDDERICDWLRMALNSTYQVEVAHTAAEGFDRIRSQLPHLVLLDVELPDQSGLQVCGALRNHSEFRQIPIIMMTGNGDKDSVVTGLLAGADDYLTKPFRLEELEARVAAILRRRA
jgi:DNA-binding response OmpR family regulator